MRVGIDTSVLVQAHLPSLERHESARRFLLEQLALADSSIVLTPLVLHELLHVITDARRFEPAVTMGEALAIVHRYLGRSNVECLSVDEDSVLLALDLVERHRLGRRRIADTLLAATLLTHGVRKLATFNTADFRVFEALDPFEPSPSLR